eukprot:TRINITY_DN34339_c0_g1_i1.p1 TRINITY_DN34339_c0_g1~~TRINITY_DN34339_c0_g1_i1.p1  ORF type:complete len:136 (+),score=40.17 TRINITY_DN34339_c0_g1_i1:115-522(+)
MCIRDRMEAHCEHIDEEIDNLHLASPESPRHRPSSASEPEFAEGVAELEKSVGRLDAAVARNEAAVAELRTELKEGSEAADKARQDDIDALKSDLEQDYGTRISAHSLSLIHISEPTRLLSISYAVFCLKKKKHM